MSTYFANLAGITEAVFFDTFELYPEQAWNQRIHEGCGHWFSKLSEISPFINAYHDDIFGEKTFNHVKENMEQFDKTFIFCDGGNKIREFQMYAPLLRKNDRIAVHDWNLEIGMGNIQQTCKEYNLIPDEPYVQSSMGLETTIVPFRKA